MSKIQLPCGYAWVDETIGVNSTGSTGAKCLSVAGESGSDSEEYEITSWQSISDTTLLPYKYKASVTAEYNIGEATIVELVNNDAVSFAKHGFAILSISGKEITFGSLDNPSGTVKLFVNFMR